MSKVKDQKLSAAGRLRIQWAESRMPVLMSLRKKYENTKPFKGARIAGCIHVTKETAVLVETLRAAGGFFLGGDVNLAHGGAGDLL